MTVLETQLGPDDPRVAFERQLLAEAEKRSRALAAGTGGALGGMAISDAPAAAREFAQIQVAYETNARKLAIVEPMFETAQFDEVRNIPVLQVLDPAIPSPKKARPRYSIVIAATLLGSIILCYVIIAILSYYRAFRRRYLHYSNGYLVTRPAARLESSRRSEVEV